MATNIVMPAMGYDMREGTVVRWRKREGDEVSRGEVIAEIETDKATVEMEAYSAGVLGKIVVEEGRTVPVGELIAVITEPGEAVPSVVAPAVAAAPASPAAAPAAAPTPVAPVPDAPAAVARLGEVRATPIARRLAREKGIDLALVTGTGPGGRITEGDVLSYEERMKAAPVAAAAALLPVAPTVPADVRATPIARTLAREKAIDLVQVTGTGPGGRITESDVLGHEARMQEAPAPAAVAPPVAPADGRVELTRMRRAIARVTSQSKRESPHFYVTSEIDMTEAMALRRQINQALEEQGARVSVNDMVIKAAALALGKFPNFNASFHDEYLQLNLDLNIGIAVALEEGLMVPAISGCQSRSLVDIASASSDLVERAQRGALRADEYTGGTFSISNLGMFDVDSFAAIIFHPNAAVLAVGTVKEQPVARDGQVAVAQMMKATVSVDHRVADGAEGARFLMEVKGHLEHPMRLLL